MIVCQKSRARPRSMPQVFNDLTFRELSMTNTLVNGQPNSFVPATPFLPAVEWFKLLSAAWITLLAFFYLLPGVDIQTSEVFFKETACQPWLSAERICGYFPYSRSDILIVLRKLFFYAPGLIALYLLCRLLDNFQHHGATYCRKKTRELSTALIAFLTGPILVVNVFLKDVSNRPRPHQTDFFGGLERFMPAGDFQGACDRNCSFVSGEAAGAGWIACLILLLPAPWRPVLGPPLVAVSLIPPALRLSFGGHYLSDVILGWLSSLVAYAAVAAYFEMSQQKIKRL
jgi:lipid A 4'-phosphatase